MNPSDPSRRIHILREIDSQKIAAGEVIDRPFSVLRELVDNSIDAGASAVEVSLSRGGLDEIRVTDNGRGMDGEDLRLCWLPHATSKIETAEDIYRTRTLGFRGEALASMAAAGKLEIVSNPGPPEISRKLSVHGGKFVDLAPHPGPAGTTVSLRDLFYAMPGRKKFLRNAGAETGLCVSAFMEKALPFPAISFKLFVDGKLRLFLPPDPLPSRVAACWGKGLRKELMTELSRTEERFSVKAIVCDPGIKFNDRKLIQIFANGRRIWDYSLTQAVEYGCASHFPGGTYPACAVFFEISPEDVDFNIHPAKKEAKFANPGGMHHALVTLLRSHFSSTGTGPEPAVNEFYFPRPSAPASPTTAQPAQSARPERSCQDLWPTPPVTGTQGRSYRAPLPLSPSGRFAARQDLPAAGNGFIYHGQLFSLFLLVEKGDRFYIIDQHAAHERIIYNELIAGKTETQELLVPHVMEVDPADEAVFAKRAEELAEAGIRVIRERSCVWQIVSVPSFAVDSEDEIAGYLSEMEGGPDTLMERLYATAACKKAVKDGQLLDSLTATELAEKALALPLHLCPHGRPVWHELSRDDLFRLVGRIV